MKYQFFATAVLQACLIPAATAWEHAYRWSSGETQQQYEQHMRYYARVATTVKDWIDVRKP